MRAPEPAEPIDAALPVVTLNRCAFHPAQLTFGCVDCVLFAANLNSLAEQQALRDRSIELN